MTPACSHCGRFTAARRVNTAERDHYLRNDVERRKVGRVCASRSRFWSFGNNGDSATLPRRLKTNISSMTSLAT